MRILALDTATPLAGVAALESGAVVAEKALAPARQHSRQLLDAIRSLLSEAGWALADVGLIAATCGPGSFTGLRIGLGTARGLALASGLPAVGVATLDAMAHGGTAANGRLAPVLDAGRGEIYTAVYTGADPPERLAEEVVIRPEQFATVVGAGPVTAFGPGLQRHREALTGGAGEGTIRLVGWEEPLAVWAGRLAGRYLECGRTPGELPLSARYVRRPDARLPGRR